MERRAGIYMAGALLHTHTAPLPLHVCTRVPISPRQRRHTHEPADTRSPLPPFSVSHTPLPSPSLVRTDKLPAFQQQPRLNMPPEKLAKKKKAPPPARGRVNFTGTATFKQLDSLQPPVTDTMKVEPGVVLSYEGATKDGGTRSFDGDRISRETFTQIANSSGGFTARRPVADPAANRKDPSSPDMPPPSPSKPPPPLMDGEAVNPALRPPSLPSSPQPGDTHGGRNPHTRERGGMPTKTKLPAPNVGATTGHGQSLPYPGADNTSSTTSVTGGKPGVKPAKNAASLLS